MPVQYREYFADLMKVEKLHKKYFQDALAEYDFTPNEVVVLMFLFNNAPALDTASDISRYKGISKGQLAASVDLLCKKGYLTANRDEKDRRVIHLSFSDKSGELLQKIEEAQNRFCTQIENGISRERIENLEFTIASMRYNVEKLLQGDKENESITGN